MGGQGREGAGWKNGRTLSKLCGLRSLDFVGSGMAVATTGNRGAGILIVA